MAYCTILEICLVRVEATALPVPFAFLRAAEPPGVVARALPLARAEAEV